MSTKDKENQLFELHESTVKTPLKQTASSNSVLTETQPATSGHLATPPKPNEISPGDPWTPTANLKVLISAASPEIRNREQEKRLSGNQSEIFEDHLSGEENEKSQPSRKEKSLGLLCHKFLALYPSYPNTSKASAICLDEVAEELNVERRRLYDIMNVLESLHMVSRLAKNRYSWHGRCNLKKTLQILKKVAEENKYMQQVQLIKKRDCEQEPEEDGQETDLVANCTSLNSHTDMAFIELPGMEFRAASANIRKDKSLRVMSQKFVMLFLVSAPQVVSLEVAAKLLIGEDHVEDLDKSKFKTKIRRLYDIANVLSSLELIEKVHVTEEKGRKPAFKWTGPDILSDVQDTHPIPTSTTIVPAHPVDKKASKEHCAKNLFPTKSKQGFTRHPSLIKLSKSVQSGQRQIRSAPSSPIKKTPSQTPSSVFPSKMAQLAAICKQQLDEQSREFQKIKMKLPSTLTSPPEASLTSEPFLPSSRVEILPLIHNSVPSAMLPHSHSNVSYAVYLHPSQTQLATACNPSFALPVQVSRCATVIGLNSPVEAGTKAVSARKFVEDSSSHLEVGDAYAKDGSPWVSEEQDGTKESTPEKSLKRCKALLEDSQIKKCKSEEADSVKNKKNPSSIALQLNQEVSASPEREQNDYESTDQGTECPKQLKQDHNHTVEVREMPAAFAVPTHEAWFPSGYLVPLAQCTQFSNEITLSNKEKAEMCSAEQRLYSSVAGGIPISTAVNFPAFHITPVNLMLPSSSVAAVPVVNGASEAHLSPIQASSSSVLNFTLQPVMPASLQISASPVLGAALVHPGAGHVSSAAQTAGPKQRKALQNILPARGQVLNGNATPGSLLQQTSAPTVSRISQEANEKISQAPGEPAIIPGSCSSPLESNGADGISQGT